jgi:hypothetical protein
MTSRSPLRSLLKRLIRPSGSRALAVQTAADRTKIRAIKKTVGGEAKIFAQIVQSTWSQLGYYHRPHTEFDSPDKKTKKRKVFHVEFERIRYTEDLIWLKVKTRKRGAFGYKSALPVGVSVTDLCTDEMRENLSHACRRHVSFKTDDYHRGFWVKISRLQTVDDLPTMVDYADMLRWYPDDTSKLPVVLGVGNNREIHQINLVDFPHVLVAGSTGGGKSNVVNVIIASIMRFADPTDVQFILIDPKRLEFSFYEGSPFLLLPPILRIQECINVLKWLTSVINSRTDKMSGAYKKLEDWNRAHPDDKIQRIILVIDEYAVLRLLPNKSTADWIEGTITNIGNLGRAVGVQMIICTQRPAATVITNAIKINCQLVIAGRTRNVDQSRVILDDGEAAMLPKVAGRMIYDTGSDRETIQVALISDAEVRACVAIAKQKPRPTVPNPLDSVRGLAAGNIPLLAPGSAAPEPEPVPAATPPPVAPEPVIRVAHSVPVEDAVRQFLAARCILVESARTFSAALYSAYQIYAATNDLPELSKSAFGTALQLVVPSLRSTSTTINGIAGRVWNGILLEPATPRDATPRDVTNVAPIESKEIAV